jgi:hypothetical protein
VRCHFWSSFRSFEKEIFVYSYHIKFFFLVAACVCTYGPISRRWRTPWLRSSWVRGLRGCVEVEYPPQRTSRQSVAGVGIVRPCEQFHKKFESTCRFTHEA